jgi:hypothetical protein
MATDTNTTTTTVSIDPEIARQIELAAKLLIADLRKINRTDEDQIGVLYAMRADITRLLADAGWTPEDLMRDAGGLAALHTSEGQA